MKQLFVAACAYAGAGLVAGVFYREYTKANDFTGFTQLSVLHTHLLALGFFGLLIVLALDKTLHLSGRGGAAPKRFTWFFWLYNVGLVVAVAGMAVRGILQVQGVTDALPALSGIAGLGHATLGAGIVVLLTALAPAVNAAARERDAQTSAAQ